MSRSGEEMVRELSKLLGTEIVKTAANKEEVIEKKEEVVENKEDKVKKSEVMLGVINDLVKLANELDSAGADDASNLVDEALQVIMNNLEEKK